MRRPHPDKVEDIYFTGALTDPREPDFYVECKDGKCPARRLTHHWTYA